MVRQAQDPECDERRDQNIDRVVRVLQQNQPNHPYLAGKWPDYPGNLRKLNPLAGEKSALDND